MIREFEINFYLDKKIVHIEPRLYATNERIALKYALDWIDRDLVFDTVRVFHV